MGEHAAALLELIDELEQGVKEDKRLAGHHRRALADKMERLRVLKERCAALGINVIVQERAHGSSDTRGAADQSRRPHR